MATRVLIVEDHDDFREIVRDYLKAQNLDLEISESNSAEAAIPKSLREKPEIILMDIRLPEMNGIDAAGHIKKSLPGCDIIILTMFETESFKKVFKSDDVSAFIGKSEIYERLVPEMKKVLVKEPRTGCA